ncbi:hypothetical protein ACH7ED_30170, partial [Klebsiella pneumoniae]
MKFKLKLLAALILGTLSLPGHSRVYEYTIKDIYGVEKSVRESANKQVISSQADSLIKISRIWADFFPAN